MDTDVKLKIKLKNLSWIILSLPLFAFASCILLSVCLHFEGSTATHCKVPNYLPSISAAIGDYTPQRYIWRICIALHCSPRLIVAPLYYCYYSCFRVDYKPALYKACIIINCMAYLVDNLSLIGLTFISSSENKGIHELFFCTFTVGALIYFWLSLVMYNWAHGKVRSPQVRFSYNIKVKMAMTNMIALLLSGYFYWRHNAYCEPGVYTLFALSEYTVVVTNVGFHGTLMYDLPEHAFLCEKRRPVENGVESKVSWHEAYSGL